MACCSAGTVKNLDLGGQLLKERLGITKKEFTILIEIGMKQIIY